MTREHIVDAAVVASFVFLAMVLAGCTPAHSSRSCLNKAEASRTWPTRDLVRDDDGCWTYQKTPPRTPVDDDPTRAAMTPADMVQWLETTAALRRIEPALPSSLWLDRWPGVVEIRPEPRAEPEKSKLTPRHVVMVIGVVALFCTVAELFAGAGRSRKYVG